MKPAGSRVVYVVSSAGRDFYSPMTRVSTASLRMTNPGVRVQLVCDAVSVTALRAAGDPLLDDVDDLLVCETPPGEAAFRNRFVKTRLRSYIDGPFLFLDSDIFVRGPLDAIFATDADIAGAPNRSKDQIGEQIWSRDREELDAMGWSIRPDVYVNGGVLFVQDREPARRLFDAWHERWLHSYERGFTYRDQPAFNAALAAVGPRLDVLPHRFNAQFRTNPGAYAGAVIWHYYASAGARPTTTFEMMVHALMRGERLDEERVQALIRSDHPWRRDPLYPIAWARNLAARHYRRLRSFAGRMSRA